MQRKTYEESCRLLQEEGLLDAGDIPPLPPGPPTHDWNGDPLGVRFFRYGIGELVYRPEEDYETVYLDSLTLPRTYFCRSILVLVSFHNTDFTESSMCWCDFDDVDFTEAKLSACDLRCTLFTDVRFTRADLRNADLRASEFVSCNFTDALMQGVKLTRPQRGNLPLSDLQWADIDWQDDDGDFPMGG